MALFLCGGHMNIKLQVNRQENANYFNVNLGDIIDIDFEDYLIAVVASEIGNSNLQACKAQAVASRTYAISRNVLIGETIADTGSVMAYRAIRHDNKKYPNAFQAINDTKGQILTYENIPIRAVYSANNGGYTTSSEERWGGSFPYLIKQYDPWDAADGNPKKGHGVGLSQYGAIYAGAHGVSYKQILQFYYPNTQLVNNYGQEVRTMAITNSKCQQIIELAKSCLGYPYVYAGAGQLCTPNNRKSKVNSSYPDVYNKCIALKNGDNCSKCKYNGQRFFDCRGFTYWIFKQVGIEISAVGATSQYNTASSWAKRGPISEIPNVICSVFKYDEAKQNMKHTGLHIGNGIIIHCTSVKTGEVQYDAVSNTTWTHYAVPKNLYTSEQLNSAAIVEKISGLKRGMAGLQVQELQQKLNDLGYTCGIDGRYGTETSDAVKLFQKKYNLTVDGLAGPITRTLILNLNNSYQTIISQPQIEEQPQDELVTLNVTRPMAQAIYKLLQKILQQ